MSDTMRDLIQIWQAMRAELAKSPKDRCFICDGPDVHIRPPGSPVGICRPCNDTEDA